MNTSSTQPQRSYSSAAEFLGEGGFVVPLDYFREAMSRRDLITEVRAAFYSWRLRVITRRGRLVTRTEAIRSTDESSGALLGTSFARDLTSLGWPCL